jgi:hypothetical protein
VKRSLICNSFDCNTKLSHHIFSNSKAESKLPGERIKAEVLLTNVEAPLSVTGVLGML